MTRSFAMLAVAASVLLASSSASQRPQPERRHWHHRRGDHGAEHHPVSISGVQVHFAGNYCNFDVTGTI